MRWGWKQRRGLGWEWNGMEWNGVVTGMGTGTLGSGSAGQCSPHRSWGSSHLPQPCPAVQLEELAAVYYEEGQKQGQRVVLGTGGFGRVELVRTVPVPWAPRRAIPIPIPVPSARCGAVSSSSR